MGVVNNRRVSFQHIVFVIFGVILMGFSIFSYSAYGQSTGVPGVDIDAENVPGLVRVEDVDGSGMQIKTGKFRVGSAQTLDLTANFEVLGDLHTYGSLLVAASGTCNTSICKFSEDGQKYPPFLVQIDQDYVGIGTNNNDTVNGTLEDGYAPGTLGVFSALDEFQNGAVYSTATSDHAIHGVSNAHLQSTPILEKAGVLGFVSNPETYAVFGKAVDISNRGIVGVKSTGGTIAGFYKGNVVVTGGFLQGNASGLVRVGSINDGLLPASDGGRGLGAWATRQDITVPAGSTTTYVMNLADGEILRSLDVLISNQSTPELFTTYGTHVAEVGDANKLSIKHSAVNKQITIINPSATENYSVRFLAQIETGVSIRVSHNANSISDTQPILYESNSYYELLAEVSATAQIFTWEFITSPARGQLCEQDGAGNPVNCVSSGSISGSSIYYKQPVSYTGTPPAETIRVTWGSATLEITRDITLQLVDLTSGVNAAEFGESTQLSLTSVVPGIYSGSSTTIFLPLATPRPGESLTPGGLYTPPNTALFSTGFDEKVTVSASFDNKITFDFDVYIVPNINVGSFFPNDGGPQATDATQTVAMSKDLEIQATVSGIQSGLDPEYSDTTATCTPAVTCSLVKNANIYSLIASEVGTKVVSVVWIPPAQEIIGGGPDGVYPSGFSYTKPSVEIYVSKIVSSGGGTDAPRDITFVINGYQNGIGTLDLNVNQNDTSFSLAVPAYNNHIGSNGNISTVVASGLNTTIANFVSVTAGSTYTVIGRNPNDLRDTDSESIVISGSDGCTGCLGSKPPVCCLDVGDVGGTS